jgi:hypothetical protein
MGASLCQEMDGKERIIAYASQNFNKHELKYATIEKEAAAILWAIKLFQPYLSGARFKVKSDHAPLKWLAQCQNATGRIARWQMRLREHSGFEGIEYLKGNENCLADGLSRCPEILEIKPGDRVTLEELRSLQERDPEFPRWQEKMEVQGDCWLFKGVPFIPSKLRDRVLSSYHGQGIHFGIRKTVELMKPVVFWPGMETDVKSFVKKCNVCQVGKAQAPQEAPIQLFKAPERPFQRVGMDFAGPFRKTTQGNKYFLVIVDHFSKYVKAFSVSENNMEAGVAGLRKLIFEEGTPEEVLTDQGSHFTGKRFQDFLKAHEIKHLRTSPYHPQCDGLAERQMRTIKELIRCAILEKINTKADDWDEILQRVVMRYNRTVHASTGRTPFALARGRTSPVTELEWIKFPVKPAQENIPWVEITDRIDRANGRNRRYRGGVLREFQEGDFVWLRGSPKGFDKGLTGPYEVVRRTSAVNYKIQNKGNIKIVHVNRLIKGSNQFEIMPAPRGRPPRKGDM